MKLVSFLVAILIHLIFLFSYFYLLQTHKIKNFKKQIYTVDIVDVKHVSHKNKFKKNKINKNNVIKLKKKHIKPKQKIVKKLKPKANKKKFVKKNEQENKKLIKAIQAIEKQKALKRHIDELKRKQALLEAKKKQEIIKEKLLKQRIEALKKSEVKAKNEKKEIKQQDVKNHSGDADKYALEYITLLKGLIYQNWGVEKSLIKNKRFTTDVYIRLDFRGNLINMNIVKSSGSVYFDTTVISAIKESEPFPMPPKEALSDGFMEFDIIFDSKERQ